MAQVEITQAMKRATLENDRKVREGSSYFHHAKASADDEHGGRWASQNKTQVTGTEAAALYPRQPSTSPFANDPCGPEPLIDGRGEGDRLGYRIDDMGSSVSASVDTDDGDGGLKQDHGTDAC